ncbi:MAG: Gx transporter family protein [Ruminococcus sp.]|nr:Gx transporter family protein [Ruminococcus sp.]
MSKKIAKVGLFVALAMIFSYIEAIIPWDFGIPGVKLGVANIVVVVALYQLNIPETAGISFVRIFLMGLLFGNVMSLAYSFSGGALSLIGMIVCKRLKLSVIGVSIVGAVLHNVGQLSTAAFILQSTAITYYFPVLLVSGLVTGFLIGILSYRVNKSLDKFSQNNNDR